ncbi:MAG: hypothetical protein CME62_13240 [Halobacteriovoraceae bacterium]|nr:hypothetical protein [Halobacteriovoraceae bacterium]|tara:strand:- start:3400 stop:4335 length:936 start_codon:yes stop_codon:yes gene_type:complete
MNFKGLRLKNVFQEEDSKFLLSCGLKFALIFIVCCIFVYYVTWVVISINNVYFESYGFFSTPEFKEAFFDNALSIFYQQLPYLFAFVIVLFFSGVYVGKILIRPFEIIGDYCQKRTEGENAEYNPDLFSDYKLLTRFSEFFFRYLDHCHDHKELSTTVIPKNFTGIRGPRFEKVFFAHFLLFTGIVALIGVSFVAFMTTEIHDRIVDLALKTLDTPGPNLAYFLNNQKELLNSINYFAMLSLTLGYILLAFHLYGKVAGAVFGFFATMRAFMKGNYNARVHLIGYAQIRPHSRALNKYLDYTERVCEKNRK